MAHAQNNADKASQLARELLEKPLSAVGSAPLFETDLIAFGFMGHPNTSESLLAYATALQKNDPHGADAAVELLPQKFTIETISMRDYLHTGLYTHLNLPIDNAAGFHTYLALPDDTRRTIDKEAMSNMAAMQATLKVTKKHRTDFNGYQQMLLALDAVADKRPLSTTMKEGLSTGLSMLEARRYKIAEATQENYERSKDANKAIDDATRGRVLAIFVPIKVNDREHIPEYIPQTLIDKIQQATQIKDKRSAAEINDTACREITQLMMQHDPGVPARSIETRRDRLRSENPELPLLKEAIRQISAINQTLGITGPSEGKNL